MRAIVIREAGGPEVLNLEEVPDPKPAEGQLLVRVQAAAVNHFDLTQRQDPAAAGSSPPFTPGVDAAGTRVDIGRHLGVTVYATASESKHDRLRALGAEPLAYDDERIEQLGAAVVFDPVGGAVFERSLAALAPGGRLVTPGAVESPMVSLNLWLLIGKQARVIGTSATTVTREDFERLIELAGKGELTPVIDRELPLAEAAEAHRLIEAREVFGKIVLRP